MKSCISLVNVNDGDEKGQQRSLKSYVFVCILMVIVGRGVDINESKGGSGVSEEVIRSLGC